MLYFKTILVNNKNDFSKILMIAKRELVKTGILKISNTSERLGLELFDYLEIKLGQLSLNDVTSPDRNLRYHRVEVSRKKIFDKFGFQPYSTTSKSLPCHTEDYFDKNPTDILLFYCKRQDLKGGNTLLAPLKNVLEFLSKKDIELLQKNIFPTYYGTTPILLEDKNRFLIKYSKIILEKAMHLNNIDFSDNLEIEECIHNLDDAIKKSIYSTKLFPKDILLINNKKILHGRSQLQMESRRLLYRKKVYSRELYI